MARRENISVSFTPQQSEFLAACVTSGRYQSISEAVREAVRLLEDQHALRQAEIERARAMIGEGAQQLTAGRTVEGEAFFREWDDELDESEAEARRSGGSG